MFDWLLKILNTPLASLTLLDLFKVFGTLLAVWIAIAILFAFLKTDHERAKHEREMQKLRERNQ